MTDLVFLDTETLGLDPTAPIWEFAAVRVRPGLPDESREFTIVHEPGIHLANMEAQGAKGAALAADYRERYNPLHAYDEARAAEEIHFITNGAMVVGCNPGFDLDSQRLTDLLWRNGIEPAWHYHPRDVSSMAEGWLAAVGRLPEGRLTSDRLALAIGVDPADYPRHTAMDDVRWMRAQWEVVSRPAPRPEALEPYLGKAPVNQ